MSAQVKSYVKGQGGVGRGARDEGRQLLPGTGGVG